MFYCVFLRDTSGQCDLSGSRDVLTDSIKVFPSLISVERSHAAFSMPSCHITVRWWTLFSLTTHQSTLQQNCLLWCSVWFYKAVCGFIAFFVNLFVVCGLLKGRFSLIFLFQSYLSAGLNGHVRQKFSLWLEHLFNAHNNTLHEHRRN